MDQNLTKLFDVLVRQLKLIVQGRYDEASELFELTDTSKYPPEISEFSETAGLMTVKLQAREMALERTIEELKGKKADLEEALKLRSELGLLFMLFTIFISLYSMTNAGLDLLTNADLAFLNPLASAIFSLILLGLSVITIKRSRLPLSRFGLNTIRLERSLLESFVATVLVMMLLSGIKLALINYSPDFAGRQLLEFDKVNWTFWLYFLIAPLQEFIARGVLQSTVARLLDSRHAQAWAIVLTSLLFGVTHTCYSFWIALISALGGLLWGWLYSRHENLIGISLSHFFIGNYILLLGLWDYIQ